MYQVDPSLVDSDQNAAASKPAHIIALPPEIIGAKRFHTIPPTWNSGIMFTETTNLDTSSAAHMFTKLTVHVFLLQIPGDDNRACTDNE